MLRIFAFFAICMVAACNTPSPHFRGIKPTTITVDGSTFEVRRRGKLAEAIRTNSQYAPRLGPIARRAEAAIEAATGCPVKEIRGDAAMVIGILKCGKPNDDAKIANAMSIPPLDCTVEDRWKINQDEFLQVRCD